MEYQEAKARVSLILYEVVHLVGICGNGTHPIVETIEALEATQITPDEAVRRAEEIRNTITEFR